MKKILSLFIAISIAISFSLPAFAVEIEEVVSQPSSWWDWYAYRLAHNANDSLDEYSFIFEYLGAFMSSEVCSTSEDNRHHGAVDRIIGAGRGYCRAACSCNFCGQTFEVSLSEADFRAAYADYLAGRGSISSDDLASGDTCLYNGVELPDIESVWTNKTKYPYALILKKHSDNKIYLCSTNYLYNVRFITGHLRLNAFSTPSGESSCYRLYVLNGDVWSLADSSSGGKLYINKTLDEVSSSSLEIYWTSNSIVNIDDDTVYFAATDPVPVGGAEDNGDRFGTYMEDLAAHNQNNPYQNNPYIPNYYISPDAGTSLYSPAIFSESSKTFTEPVTGAQILCTDWIYHYVPDGVVAGIDGLEHEYLGAYILSPTENSFAYGSSFVDLICLIYTDSFLRIGFMVEDTSTDVGFRSLGSQDYSYVTVAQTSCGLGDHDMTWEVTQPPTCSSSGTQTGTCSICGDIQTYQLDPLPHTYQSSVTQQPTCADAGIMTYACTVCGFSYTEQIAPTGDHDWLPSEVTGTVYDLPEGTSCPDCSGTNYTHSLSGDLYDCTCTDCGTEWTVRAEITYGRTTYTCSVCGASYVEQEGEEDGLFAAIANFLSDGITWVTDKFTELAESLSGIHTTFRAYLERIRNVGGDFPALIAAAVGVMPSDFMDVVWFGVICMVLLAVYLKFFR